MTDEQNRIIREIEKLQLAVEKRFIDQYPVLFADLYRDVLEVTSNIRFSGSADTRAAQLLELMRVKKRIAAIISDNPNYVKAVKEVTDSFVEVRNLTDDYFRTVIDGYKPKQDLYTAILKANVEATKDALLGAGISDEFAKPITDTIRATLLKKSNKEPLNVALQRMIEGYGKEKPLLEAALQRNSRDAVQFFNAQYLDVVSADLNISYYIYSGTAIETSRPFCKSKVGKIFKKSTVEGWAKQQWEGRYPGTDSETIFTYRGGYNCRHQLWPSTKAAFTIQEKKKN
jgi:hypothetical protein